MGLIQKLLGKSSEEKVEFKAKLKSAEEDEKVNRLITEKQKSSNQREVERYVKEKQEEEYKEILDKIRKKQSDDMWSSKKNNMLNSQHDILKNERPILKEKNIFIDNKSDVPFNKKKGMFFKW
jgi:thioredoxin-like negative regulator of GroEL